MIEQAQGVLSNSMGIVMGAGSAARTLAGAHPVGLGIIVGIGAYFVVNKYWLNDSAEEDAAEETEAAA